MATHELVYATKWCPGPGAHESMQSVSKHHNTIALDLFCRASACARRWVFQNRCSGCGGRHFEGHRLSVWSFSAESKSPTSGICWLCSSCDFLRFAMLLHTHEPGIIFRIIHKQVLFARKPSANNQSLRQTPLQQQN